ncbi:JmjC domain protein [Aspergillus sp. HF37]|nr:JmjC domain protein [Aspergillus sp. HF37]
MKLQRWLFYNNPRVCLQIPPTIPSTAARCFSSSHRYRPLRVLHDTSIPRFRESCFTPEAPAILPRPHFADLPAYARWLTPTADPNVSRLNAEYLEEHGGNSFVPLELTQAVPEPSASTNGKSLSESETETETETGHGFRRFHAPLSLFLQWMRAAETQPQITRLYLAQCQLLDLPQVLRDDFPPPDLVACAGRGDVYDTNVWIGHPPTYTPLHRDPNPNLFVQLAGRKTVRLLSPDEGSALFGAVRRRIGKNADRSAAAIRGDDMMQGEERVLLERAVWGCADSDGAAAAAASGGEGYEAQLDAGDGVFIPKGWWHSIKGVGEGVTASVNWWFR